MISTLAELRSRGLSSPLRPLLTSGDWYLVGSRSTDHGDGLSDWDTILLTGSADATVLDRHVGQHGMSTD